MSKISLRIGRQNTSVFGEAGSDINQADTIDEIKEQLGIGNTDTNNLAGVPLNITGLSNNDVLRYSGSATEWTNVNQTILTDGGNF